MADPDTDFEDDFEVYNEDGCDWEPDDAEVTDDDLSGAEEDLADDHDSEPPDAEERLQAAQDLVENSYVVPDSEYLPLPTQTDPQHFLVADVLACSYPSSQHDPGAAAELVSLQHWIDDTGQDRCKIEAFLPGSSQSDMGRLTPVIQGVADLPGPFSTVDRAGDLVAAGSEYGAILVWQLRPDTAEGMRLVGQFSVDVNSTINSVRFGMWSGGRRLIAACQEGQVLLLDAPGREEPLTAQDMLLNGATLNTEVCSVFVSLKLNRIERGDPQITAVLSPSKFFKGVGTMHFDEGLLPTHYGMIPTNSATPSPNGQWMAICSGMPQHVLILSADNKEPHVQFEMCHSGIVPIVKDGLVPPGASQYASWNASGTLVTVTSDGQASVTVYNMKTRRVVLRLLQMWRACLAVAWHPHDDNILVFAESHSAVHIVDVRFPLHHQQLLMGEGLVPGALRINGLCISPDSRLWVATKEGLRAWQLLRFWSPDSHKHWPSRFRALVRELLVGCLAQHTREAAAGAPDPAADIDSALLETLQHLHGLPSSVLLNIFQLMAELIGFWQKTSPLEVLPSWPGKDPNCAEFYLPI